MQQTVSIAGLSKAAVFAALYNAARPQGQPVEASPPISEAKAEVILAAKRAYPGADGRLFFDLVNDRVLKIDLTSDEIDPWRYDPYNGMGMCATVIAKLRQPAATHVATEVPVVIHADPSEYWHVQSQP